MRHKYILTTFLFICIILIIWLYFFETYRLPALFQINPNNINKLIENLSLAFIASYLFYFIVVFLKEKDERKIIYPFVADYTYILMNIVTQFAYSMKSKAGIIDMAYETSIYNRNFDIYPTKNELDKICNIINPNKKINESNAIPNLITIPHFFGIMIKNSLEVDYYLKIILEKSNHMDVELLSLLTEIKTCDYHKRMTQFDKESLLTAANRHDDLNGYINSFDRYFTLFRELEIYSENNLKKYVKRTSLKTRTNK
jgi:hypothetical protein